ncbi:T7SS effector LXG polymorphic toxin [Scopulibacillus darangshiensis]|nr:T7SS effector LXG polymorphic toxin [Scopulibacillus darangshiensis]
MIQSAANGGSNKIFDSKALIAAIGERHDHYETMQNDLTGLKEALQGVATLGDDEFTGKGAEAIKGFYKAQVEVVDKWLDLVAMQLAFLKAIPGKVEDEALGSGTVVDLSFLFDDLARSGVRSKDIVLAQQDDLQKIFDGIKDIISLDVFSTQEFNQHIDEAEKERNQTIHKVTDLDNHLTSEYAKIELESHYVQHFFSKLLEASSQNGSVNPMYYNAKTFHSSDVYQMKDEIGDSVKGYLNLKDQEELVRKRREQEELFHKAPELNGIDEMQTADVEWEIVNGIGVGTYDFAKDTATGIWNLIRHPVESVQRIVYAVKHADKTFEYVRDALVNSFDHEMIHGDAYSRSRWITYSIETIAASAFGTKGVDKFAKSAKMAERARKLSQSARRTANQIRDNVRSADFNPFRPLQPQYQMAGVPNGIPFNVFDTGNIKNTLRMIVPWNMAKVYKNYEPMDYKGNTKVNGEIRDISRRVYQRKDIDLDLIDPKTGKSNLELMKKGRSPVWKDGTAVELHHLIQKEPGSMVEIPASMHDEYTKILHGLVKNGGSFRNDPVLRKQYDNFRAKYWRWRAKQIDKGVYFDK